MTEQERQVQREAQALRDALRLFGPAASHASKFKFVPSEQLHEQAARLDYLSARPNATPEALRELHRGLELMEQIARGLQSPPRYPFVEREPVRELAGAASLGKQLEAQVQIRREAIAKIG